MSTAVDRLAEDQAARQRALELASFIVEAPAGAGKTELLTQRYLRLLAVVEHPEEVLALTFTNKAATEMRDRILRSLARAAADDEPAEDHKRETYRLAKAVLQRDALAGWHLLDHPGRLRITTLDALCASLARQMPFLSRFGSQPGVTEDADEHYRTAARRTLALLEGDDPAAEVVAEALAFLANDAGRLERLLVAMLGKRDQWLAHAHRLDDAGLREEVEAGFALLVERELACVAATLDGRMQTLLQPLARFAAAQVPAVLGELAEWQVPLGACRDDLATWQALGRLLLTGGGTLRKTLDKRIGFPPGAAFAEQKQAMLACLDELRQIPGAEAALSALPGLPTPGLSEAEWSTVDSFARLLRLAAAQLWLAFQEAGEVDFIEIAARAGQALGEDEAPTELAQALDYRIQHLLVDEFQDTSPGQVELLKKLMRGWTPGDGRTLFVVGDPMQSIYRFRKADVGLFLRVRDLGIGDVRLEHLRLFRNNRSFPAVVDWVNTAFPTIFPAEDSPESGAVRYAESAATLPALATAGVEVHPLIMAAGEDGDAREARHLLQLIRSAQAEAPGERIAVLVRARSHLAALVAEIRRSAPGMRFQAVEIEGLADRQPIQDLLTLFRALTHRADRVHWLALLRAPWCGLRLADLHALAAGDRLRTVWQLMHDPERLAAMSEDGRQRLLAVREVLALAFAERDRQSPRCWLEGVWLMLDGPACLDAPDGLADVERFFALVEQLTAAHRLDAETLAAQAAELFAPPDPLADESLQMMTIHKSKGLEFETVILPGLHREPGSGDSPLLLWDQLAGADGETHLLVAPLKRQGGEAALPTAYDFLRRVENARAGHESERLLYVAATRAIRRLHLVACASRDDGKPDGIAPPPAGTLLRLLWPGVAQAAFAAAGVALAAPATRTSGIDPASFQPPLLRLRQPGVPAPLRALPEGERPAGNPLSLDLPAAAVSLEASVGTLVHRCLELIARQGLAAWPLERVAGLLPGWQRWLQGRGHAADAAGEGAADVLRAVATTLGCTSGRWLLAAHPEAAAEQAWSSRQGEATVNHVIDRVFVADGERWIVDYKTVRAEAAELPARAEGFRPQLARYARLFAGDPRPLRLAIYFPLQGILYELPRA